VKRRLSKAKKAEFARFFEYVYQRALQLDPRELEDTDDLVSALTTLRAGARSGHYEVTGEWLNANGKVG
jgi:hypothetical protein